MYNFFNLEIRDLPYTIQRWESLVWIHKYYKYCFNYFVTVDIDTHRASYSSTSLPTTSPGVSPSISAPPSFTIVFYTQWEDASSHSSVPCASHTSAHRGVCVCWYERFWLHYKPSCLWWLCCNVFRALPHTICSVLLPRHCEFELTCN